MRTAVLAASAMLAAPWTLADVSDEDALLLADKTAAIVQPARDWRAFVEFGGGAVSPRDTNSSSGFGRLSLDLRYEASFATAWRAVLADRLDMAWEDSLSNEDHVNTLQEAYVSWQARPDRIGDLGRINLRYGVATGYNPTDYFRAGALRSVVSIDPESLRSNRLGSVVLRGQALWRGGSFTGLWSPRLERQRDTSPFGLDLGATNRTDRWLLAQSQQLAEGLSPQWLLYGEAGRDPQIGANLTALLNDATVGYLEWSGGRSPSIAAQALGLPDDSRFRSRLSTGATYTAPIKLSLTAEYQYNGAALASDEWDALRRGPPGDYARYRALAGFLQDPPTQHRVFLRAHWQDAGINHLDLTSNVFLAVLDQSRQYWVEARYHWPRLDATVQWQLNSGSAGSEFGALPTRSVWQAFLTLFF